MHIPVRVTNFSRDFMWRIALVGALLTRRPYPKRPAKRVRLKRFDYHQN